MGDQSYSEAKKEAFRRFWKRGPSARSGNAYGSAIVGIGRGPAERGGKLDEKRKDCIRFYVSSKAARGVLAPTHESFIPPVLNGIPTDVFEVGRIRPFNSSVSPGALVALDENSTVAPSDFGALGALVKEAKSGALGIVTCNHVIAWNGLVSPGSRIQVATRDEMVSDEPYAVARLVNWIHLEHGADNLGDCAYATFERDYPSAQSFGALDPVSAQEGVAEIGDPVVRIGGTVAGYVADVSATIDVDYEFGTFRMVNQIVIQAPPGERFATEGDSGSVVLRDAGKERVPIALVWGGRRNLTYASPLKTCLEKLDLTWVAPMGRTGSATGY